MKRVILCAALLATMLVAGGCATNDKPDPWAQWYGDEPYGYAPDAPPGTYVPYSYAPYPYYYYPYSYSGFYSYDPYPWAAAPGGFITTMTTGRPRRPRGRESRRQRQRPSRPGLDYEWGRPLGLLQPGQAHPRAEPQLSH